MLAWRLDWFRGFIATDDAIIVDECHQILESPSNELFSIGKLFRVGSLSRESRVEQRLIEQYEVDQEDCYRGEKDRWIVCACHECQECNHWPGRPHDAIQGLWLKPSPTRTC